MEDETQKELEEVVNSAVPSGLSSLLEPSCRCSKPAVSVRKAGSVGFNLVHS